MKKGKLALIIISGLIGISVIANMFGDSSNKTNNNANSKKQENESAKVEQKIEKTEEELKKEEEQKKREEKRPESGQAKVAARVVPSVQPKVNSNVREVYITPTGKRYHYDPQCGGKNSYKGGINSVGGRTPCQKCVH